MKRTIPLLITAIGGFVLIAATFIPATESWGEKATVWFDILAGIAFILGGANLFRIHLTKISDHQPGWAYSAITLASFLIVLIAGLCKLGVPPAPDQEFVGETFAELPLDQLPPELTFVVPGILPEAIVQAWQLRAESIGVSVRRQTSLVNGQLQFRGWLEPDQQQDLEGFSEHLDWQCAVSRLAELAKPPPEVADQVRYASLHQSLAATGILTPEDVAALQAISPSPDWQAAVDQLVSKADYETTLDNVAFPPLYETPAELTDRTQRTETTLTLRGPLSAANQAALLGQFSITRPWTPNAVSELLAALNAAGPPLTPAQSDGLSRALAVSWQFEDLLALVQTARDPPALPAVAPCAALQADRTALPGAWLPGEPPLPLTPAHTSALQAFIENPAQRIADLLTQLSAAGPLTAAQLGTVERVLTGQPTRGQILRRAYTGLMAAELETAEIAGRLPQRLNDAQRGILLDVYRREVEWNRVVATLAAQSHRVKYPWSGRYIETGSLFWWSYEYMFSPLSATVFALLAFYVASAAFRAFRAKNAEALLLLLTAFIILLGRSQAGTWLTGWFPDELAFLRADALTVWIMQTVNTAGSRAIMIGIALGLAATSAKVLIGIDRSYLGSGDD